MDREIDSTPSNRAQADVNDVVDQEDYKSVITKAEQIRKTTSIDLMQSPSSIGPFGFQSPTFQLTGPDGQPEAISDANTFGYNGDLSRRFQRAAGSDGVSSVTSIFDLGFDMAPRPPQDSFTTLGLDKVADTDIEETIREMIDRKLDISKMDDHEYLPIDIFEAIFSSQAVELVIKSTRPELDGDLQERLKQIMGIDHNHGLRRILATLVMVKRVSYIEKFIHAGVHDIDLPIRRNRVGGRSFTTNDNKEIQVFQNWPRNDIELFFIYQDMMFVPFFDIREDQLCSYEFGTEIRLPWQEYEAKTRGGNSLIHKVQIHPSHLRFRSPNGKDGSVTHYESALAKEEVQQPICFALKEIFSSDREAYSQELRALEKSFSQKQREKHLIKLLLTFKHGEKYFLLFEWADGNLEEFWEQHNRSAIMSDSWFIKQCLGISSALKRIHGLATWQEDERSEMLATGTASKDNRHWGRHGDIKPHNILWFNSYENESHHLVMSDLGLTQFHSHLTKSDVPISRIQGCTQAYRAPEMDLGYKISQKYDIWSLGCVFLEFCLWSIFDIHKVREFGYNRESQDESEIPQFQEDKFFNIIIESGERRALMKPCIKKCIKTIRDSERCTHTNREILNLIEEKMLQTEPEKRDNINLICRKLKQIQDSIPEDAEPPAPKNPADIPLPSSVPDLIDTEKEVPLSAELDPAQRGLQYHSVFHHAQGGSDIISMDTSVISTRPRAISIGSQSARSEGESSMENDETRSASVSDQPVETQELDQDSPDARRARREAPTEVPSVPRNFIGYQDTATQTEPSTFAQIAQDGSSSMDTSIYSEPMQRKLGSPESTVIILGRRDDSMATYPKNHRQLVTKYIASTTLWRVAVHGFKKCTSLQWWGSIMKSVAQGVAAYRRRNSDSSQPPTT